MSKVDVYNGERILHLQNIIAEIRAFIQECKEQKNRLEGTVNFNRNMVATSSPIDMEDEQFLSRISLFANKRLSDDLAIIDLRIQIGALKDQIKMHKAEIQRVQLFLFKLEHEPHWLLAKMISGFEELEKSYNYKFPDKQNFSTRKFFQIARAKIRALEETHLYTEKWQRFLEACSVPSSSLLQANQIRVLLLCRIIWELESYEILRENIPLYMGMKSVCLNLHLEKNGNLPDALALSADCIAVVYEKFNAFFPASITKDTSHDEILQYEKEDLKKEINTLENIPDGVQLAKELARVLTCKQADLKFCIFISQQARRIFELKDKRELNFEETQELKNLLSHLSSLSHKFPGTPSLSKIILATITTISTLVGGLFTAAAFDWDPLSLCESSFSNKIIFTSLTGVSSLITCSLFYASRCKGVALQMQRVTGEQKPDPGKELEEALLTFKGGN